jgi:capsular exopolysaccharide synthesis family protein
MVGYFDSQDYNPVLMSTEKPVHVPRQQYPESMYPQVVTTINGEYQTEGPHPLEYWRIITTRKWVILAILATVLTTTILYNLKATPIYRATTTIQIDKENQNILSFKDVYELESSSDDTLRTQFEILKSRSIARGVIEELSLDKIAEFQGKNWQSVKWLSDFFGIRPHPDAGEPDRLRPVIDSYLEHLDVSPVLRARLVNVTFDSKDPELATRIINAHAKHFIEQNLQYKWEATQQASEFLSQNLVTLKATLEKSEDQLQAYSRENEILFTDDGKNTATEKLRQLEETYTKAQADRIEKESYEQLVKDEKAEALPQLVNNRLIADLTAKLADLQRQESEISVTFRPDYPLRQRIAGQVSQIQNSIDAERARTLNMIETEYSASLARERLLAGELDKQRDVVNKINQEIIQYNILKREVESNKQLHDGLLTRLKEAGVSAGLKASNIRVVDRAEVPQWPVRPRRAINLALGLMGGLVFGIGFAFLQEYLDNSLKAPEDITRHLNLATLGIIPKLQSLDGKRRYGYGKLYGYGHTYSDGNANPLTVATPGEPKNVDRIVHEAPSSLMAEAYRSIRTSLLLSSPGHPPKTIVVTSASPSEGKTVTAINLAISLTQTGSRVVLIDADMRKPRVHNVFSLGQAVGLSSFLAGASMLKEVIHETSVPNLLVIPCGATPPNPGELVLSPVFRRMTEALREYFDYIVLDSPPVGNVSDARILGAAADSTILVVKAFSTSRHHARNAVNHLLEARTRLAGVVLNDIDVRLRSYYSGSYYKTYYSGYGQNTSSKPA